MPADARADRAAGAVLRELVEAEFAALSAREFIVLACRRTLGREPRPDEMARLEGSDADPTTPEGRAHLFGEITALAKAGAHPSARMIDRAAPSAFDNASFVTAIYRRFLLRDPQPTERERSVNSLDEGVTTRSQLVDKLLGSAEFAALWLAGTPHSGRNGAVTTATGAAVLNPSRTGAPSEQQPKPGSSPENDGTHA
jgi:hypothetical protein